MTEFAPTGASGRKEVPDRNHVPACLARAGRNRILQRRVFNSFSKGENIMSWNTTFALAGVVLAAVSPALGQELNRSAEDEAFGLAVQVYGNETAVRTAELTALHAEAVVAAMNRFDGSVIVQDYFDDGALYALLWNAQLPGFVVTRDGSDVPVSQYTDEYGRPAFESLAGGVAAAGWLDVTENRLHLLVTAGEASYRWIADLPSGEEESAVGGPPSGLPLIDGEWQEPKRTCKCGPGGLSLCPHQHCEVPTQCTQPNGNTAQCVWQTAQEKPAQDPQRCQPGGGLTMFMGGFFGMVTFCRPIRRVVLRRVRRPDWGLV